MDSKVLVVLTLAVATAASDKSLSISAQQSRVKRQLDFEDNTIQGSAIDFSQAVFDEDTGLMCVIKETEVQSIEKEPILECNHREVEKCHYTYVTQFRPAQEEVCEESFEKTCQITFKQQPLKESVKKCYRPLLKVCNGQGKEVCQTVYESSCTTRYIEKQPGKFVGDTSCEKVPIEVCGAGCVTEEGPEECHNKDITSLVDVPEEICDLNPQKSCRLQTKLVPSLMPKHECTIVPQEVCQMKFTAPKLVKKPLMSKWCLDEEGGEGAGSDPVPSYKQAKKNSNDKKKSFAKNRTRNNRRPLSTTSQPAPRILDDRLAIQQQEARFSQRTAPTFGGGFFQQQQHRHQQVSGGPSPVADGPLYRDFDRRSFLHPVSAVPTPFGARIPKSDGSSDNSRRGKNPFLVV